jgi:TM2 domain-containing membrane protein YozV
VSAPLPSSNAPLTPDSGSAQSHFGNCANCGATLYGPFCAKCGEKRIDRHDYSLRTVGQEIIDELSPVDSKILRTLRALVTKPGLLSQHYFEHGRSRYTKPLTLFVALNLVFFFIQPYTGLLRYSYAQYTNPVSAAGARRAQLVESKLAVTHETPQNYQTRFDLILQQQKKSMLIFSVPLLAAVMFLIYAGSGRYYAEHLVFSIHVYAFLLIFMALIVTTAFALLFLVLRHAGSAAQPMMTMLKTEATLVIVVSVGLATYIALGLHRAYRDRWVAATVRGILLSMTIFLILLLYRDALFYLTLWMT